MTTLCLKLGPVYSRLADATDLQGLDVDKKLPQDLKLRRHQAQTWQAYNDPDIDVIFDTALTGDGKSLAGQLPMLTQGKYSLLLYPTNELISDQLGAVEGYIKRFGLSHKANVMFSEEISERMLAKGLNRKSQILSLIDKSNFILSNPDLFHLMSSFNYGGSNQNKADFVYRIPEQFDYFVFDEFHIFGPPQVIAVMNILNYHRVVTKRPLKYIFLSATPTQMFKKMLENSGFRVKTVKGDYSTMPMASYSPNPIVQPVSLQIDSLTEKGAYAWAEAHLDVLKEFYRANPESKGVFIVNSVAIAKRLTEFYIQALKDTNITVGENTGLTNKDERKRAMHDADLIIATSTIDIGVDFDINLLIFESYNAGTFVQRLGRLGRHHKVGWQEYRAYALLPDWIAEKFANRFPGNEPELNRLDFLEAVRGHDQLTIVENDPVAEAGPIFLPDQEYRNYAGIWGCVQTAHIITSAESYEVGQMKGSESAQQLRQQYNRAYGGGDGTARIDKAVGRYLGISKDKRDKLILDELNSFRGQSSLACGILDETDGYFKTYDLFFLLANTNFQPISEAEFKQALAKRSLADKFNRYESRDLKLYVRLKSYLAERENFTIQISRSLGDKFYQVHAFKGFTIKDNRIMATHSDDTVNDRLAALSLVGMAVPGKPKDFKRQNRLDPLFPVYQVKDATGSDERSIIFGLNAVLAHSQVYWKAAKAQAQAEEFTPLIF